MRTRVGKTVKYRNEQYEDPVDAIVLADEGGISETVLLLLPPSERGECSCIVMAKLDFREDEDVFVDIEKDSWVNLPSRKGEFQKVLDILEDNRLYK